MINKVFEYIDKNSEQYIEDFKGILRIPSEQGEPAEGKPFGSEVARAYEFMQDLAQRDEFDFYDADGYGGHIEFKGSSDKIMGIIGHIDVVPAGKEWDMDPYAADEKDGKIYARGTTDDKGPVMACYYAMKALKECGYEPKTSVRLILGLDEETDWIGMYRYLKEVRKPDFGFTPDANFPAIQGEKGILIFDIAGKFAKGPSEGLRLRFLKGGNAPNMVADSARAVLLSNNQTDYEKIKDKIEEIRNSKGYSINTKKIGKSLEIVTHGISAHGARPEDGLNAISIMMEILGRFTFSNDDAAQFIDFYNRCIGFDLCGENMGCGFSDEPSGKLVFNVGKINMDEKAVELTCNIRYPVTSTEEEVYDGMGSVLEKYDLGVVKGHMQKPIYLSEDNPLIATLMDVYRKHSGDKTSKPVVIGGGTYARAFDTVVAYGAVFPGETETMHQKNECIEKDNMIRLAKLYAEAIYELDKKDI